LEVLSERMLREGQGGEGGEGEEVFVVRWRTREEDEFCGVFLFEFDDVGRIGRHVIEEVERGGDTSEEGEGGRGGVVGVTEWLLRKARGARAGGGGGGGGGGLAWECEGVRGR